MTTKKEREKAAKLMQADLSLLDPESFSGLETKLREERNRRTEEFLKKKRQEAEVFNRFVFKNKANLVRLFPMHKYGGSDVEACQDEDRMQKCPRCFLMRLEEWQLLDIEIKFDMEFNQL